MAYLYPYGDTQQLNLDWLIEQWNEVKSQIDGSLQEEIDRVEAAITDLLTARDEAVAAQTAAQASAQAAAGSASTASGAASTATAQAQAAAGSAATAGAHASDAQGYAATAQQAAQAANNSAGAAAVSEGNARNSETAAAGSSSAAAGNALYAEGYAKGTQNGNPVGSGSPYYENNAKYYSDQAAQDAQDAQDAATLLKPPATSADIGKALIVKTVGDGTVTSYELGESGGGGGDTPGLVETIENVQIASFDDGLNAPVQQIIVDIDPVQRGSGDPAPDNIRPISGWTGAKITRTGKNLLKANIQRTLTPLSVTFDTSIATWIKANTTYYFSFDVSNATSWRVAAILFDANGNRLFGNGIVSNILVDMGTYFGENSSGQYYIWGSNANYKQTGFNFNVDCYVQLYFNLGDTSESTAFSNCQLELERFTDYEPYTGTIYTLQFPAEAGTVYGGTLTNLGTNAWNLKVDRAKRHFSGNDTWNIASGTETSNRAILTLDDAKTGSYIGLLSDVFAPSVFSNPPLYAGCQSPISSIILGIPLTITTRAEMNDWVSNNPFDIVYYLETPIEYTFTTAEVIQILSGYNNVWADIGNINLLQYYADSKKYIDDQDALIKALIAKELPSMTADTALVANDFRIVNNTLYRVTAPVASGGTLTPGTNCAATTITDILKTLL